MDVIGMAVDHKVNMHIPKARQDAHPFGADDLGTCWQGQGAYLPHSLDLLFLDENDAVL